MVLGKTPSSRRSVGNSVRRAAVLAALLALAACNPIDTWRDLTGASQNDPDPETTPNTKNLAAGEASDYPNLATVPPPPTRALTTAEREKLTQSLIADRTNAKYTDDQLRAGFSAISAAVPPPPPPPAAAEPGDKTAKPGDESRKPDAPAPPPAPAGGAASAAAAPGPRKAGEPPEPGPKESSLEAPQARATPTPEQSRPAPPAPGGVRGSSAPGPTPMPPAIDTAKYQPPPPPPVLAPAAPVRTAAAAPEKHLPPPTATPVGEFKFAGASTSLTDSAGAGLDKVVSAYRQKPGRIRIVGYAGVGSGAEEQLASYRVALDRAQAVAAALAKAGIPSDKILAEVAPSASDSGEGRAEVTLEH